MEDIFEPPMFPWLGGVSMNKKTAEPEHRGNTFTSYRSFILSLSSQRRLTPLLLDQRSWE